MRVARTVAIGFTLLLTYLLVAPAPLALFGAIGQAAQQAIERSVTDTLQHASAYAIFTGLWILATRGRGSRLAVILLAMLHGAATEALHAIMPQRQFDWSDMLANLCGITLGVVLAWFAALLVARRRSPGRSAANPSGRDSFVRGFERVLLYTVALILGASMLLDRSGREHAGPAKVDRPDGAATHAAGLRAEAHGPNAENPAVQPPAQHEMRRPALEPQWEAVRQSLVLVDGQGRRRIELRVGDDGQPKVALNDEAGQPVILLRAGPERSGQVVLETGRGSARLIAEPDEFALELRNTRGGMARVALAPDGQTEVSARSDGSGPNVALRTTTDGSAQVSVGGSEQQPAARLVALASGHLELRMTGARGVPGPALQLFEDATAQLTLDGPGNQSGPSLIRFADGTSVVSVRRSDGNPAASMVAGTDGTAIIAAVSPRGGKQAELRVSADGKATIAVVEPKPDRPDEKQDPPAPVRPLVPAHGVLSAP